MNNENQATVCPHRLYGSTSFYSRLPIWPRETCVAKASRWISSVHESRVGILMFSKG